MIITDLISNHWRILEDNLKTLTSKYCLSIIKFQKENRKNICKVVIHLKYCRYVLLCYDFKKFLREKIYLSILSAPFHHAPCSFFNLNPVSKKNTPPPKDILKRPWCINSANCRPEPRVTHVFYMVGVQA